MIEKYYSEIALKNLIQDSSLKQIHSGIEKYTNDYFNFDFDPSNPVVRLHEPTFGADEIKAAVNTLLSTKVTSGKSVIEFEEAFSKKVKLNNCVSSNSGSSATDVTMSFANVSGFVPGEILKAKSVGDTGFSVEYWYVTGSQRYTHPSSSYSASIASSSMGAIDPDGLAGEIYVGRGYGTITNISSSIGTLDGAIAASASYSTEINIGIDFYWKGLKDRN